MSNDVKEYKLVPYTNDDEIEKVEILSLFLKIWSKRKIIFLITTAFTLYGAVLSLATPEEFTSTSSILPVVEERHQLSGMMQQFSGLLGSSGFSVGSEGSEIDAALYSDIIFSTPAMYEMINSKVYSPKLDSTLTLEDYMLEYRETSTLVKVTSGLLNFTVHLPITIIKGIYNTFRWVVSRVLGNKEQQIVSEVNGIENELGHQKLTIEEFSFIRDMKDKIKTEQNTTNGLFSVEVSLPEAEVASQINQFVIDYLANYIIDYRTKKLVRNLNFIDDRYDEAKLAFEEAQNNRADFRDRNIAISTEKMRIEEQRLESEYQLRFELFNAIAHQRAEARINLEESTPIFNTLEPVSIPTNRSKPARAVMTVTYAIFGIFVALFWIFFKSNFIDTRNSELQVN